MIERSKLCSDSVGSLSHRAESAAAASLNLFLGWRIQVVNWHRIEDLDRIGE